MNLDEDEEYEIHPIGDEFRVSVEQKHGEQKVSLFFGDDDTNVQFWLAPEDAEALASELTSGAQACRVSNAA